MVDFPSRLSRKRLTAVGIAAVGAVSVLVLATGWYAQGHYFAWQDHVAMRLSTLPPAEANPPPVAIDVIRTLEGSRLAVPVARALVSETHGNRMRHLERNALNALWSVLLPVTLEEREVVALYGSVMYFDGGYGLTYGANHHFAKTPADLTRDEMIGLFTIAWNPTAYSPERNPERYEQQVTRFQERYLIRQAEQNVP